MTDITAPAPDSLRWLPDGKLDIERIAPDMQDTLRDMARAAQDRPAHVEVPVQLVDALVNDGDLTETDTTDPWALGAALVGAVRKLRERYANRPDARRIPQPRRRATAPTSWRLRGAG